MNLETIVQGGAVGLCALMVIARFWEAKLYNKTMNNHLVHTEKAQYAVAESNTKLAEALSKLTTTVGGCPQNKLNRE